MRQHHPYHPFLNITTEPLYAQELPVGLDHFTEVVRIKKDGSYGYIAFLINYDEYPDDVVMINHTGKAETEYRVITRKEEARIFYTKAKREGWEAIKHK